MFENLRFRWSLILCALIFGIYFIFPSFQLYIASKDTSLAKIKQLQDSSIDLGLDLKGGLHIILELDIKTFLTKLARLKLSKSSKEEYKELIQEAEHNAVNNNTDIIVELNNVANQRNVKLNKFLSNLSKSTNNNDIIDQIKEQKLYAMSSILEIMRNRIEAHDQYGLGEPSIQKLGEDRLMIELAGISDVSRAKEYIQRTADFELTLVKNQKLQSYLH